MSFTQVARCIIVESLSRGAIRESDRTALQNGFCVLPVGLAILAAGAMTLPVVHSHVTDRAEMGVRS